MNSKHSILERVRSAARAPVALPDIPQFGDPQLPLLPQFKMSLERMGGTWIELNSPGELAGAIHERFPHAARICSATPALKGTVAIDTIQTPVELHDIDVGVVEAAFSVAETGSLWLSESQLKINALGYLPQHLVALLDPADIIGNLHQAYQRAEFLDAAYCVLMSGPSATADIEGVLIRGAQGVRSLTVVLLPMA